MLNKEQFEEIKEALADYRFKRGLFYENQRKGFLGNIFEEISEYLRAENDNDRAEELCDMAIFVMNAYDFKYDNDIFLKTREYSIYDIVKLLLDYYMYYEKGNYANITATARINEYNLSLTIFGLERMINHLGFDFYKCLKEKIKAINSRSGQYDNGLNKWIKDKSPEAVAKWYEPDFSNCHL